MCGALKFENQNIKIGSPVAVQFTNHVATHRWCGFAKAERYADWKTNTGAESCKIVADAFVEGNVTLRVPAPIEALCIGEHNGDWVDNQKAAVKGTVKIVTRAALNSFERGIHSRWPAVRNPTQPTKYYQWTHKDVLIGQQEMF